MKFLLEVTANTTNFPITAVVVLIVGFLAAVTVGSIAWYNSKRPVGWEDKKRPDIIPDIKK